MGGGSSKNKQKKASEEVRVQKQYEHVPTEMSKASPYPTSNKKFDEISNLGEEEIYRPQIIKQLPRPVSERHDGKTLEAMISKLIIQNSEKLDENFILDIWGKHLSDKDFIREAKNLKFPKIKQVRLRWLGEFKGDKEMKDVNEFMENSIRSNLPYL